MNSLITASFICMIGFYVAIERFIVLPWSKKAKRKTRIWTSILVFFVTVGLFILGATMPTEASRMAFLLMVVSPLWLNAGMLFLRSLIS